MEYLTSQFTGLVGADFRIGDDALIDGLVNGSGDALETGVFRGIASFFGGVVDAFIPSVIHQGAFVKTLRERRDNVKLLLQHDIFTPIGKPLKLNESDRGLELEGRISDTTDGRDTITLMRDGVLDALSIGFDPVKFDFEELPDGTMIRNLREIRLFEISIVTFGADPNARITEVNGLIGDRGEAYRKHMERYGFNYGRLEHNAITPFRDFPLAGRGRRWNSDAAESRVRAWAGAEDGPNAQYKRAFVFFDRENEDNFGAYKLQIADVIDGKLTAVPRAVFAAAAALQGARGGVDIPDSDEAGARRHLERYYAKMRKEFDDDSIIAPWNQEANGFDPRDCEPLDAAWYVSQQLSTVASMDDVRRAYELLSALCDDGVADPAQQPVTTSEGEHEHLALEYAAMQMDAQVLGLA
jgi:HK97 family phage prohead protease